MKNLFTILAFIALAFVASQSHAQIVTNITLSKTSLSATDTAKATLSVVAPVMSVEVRLVKTGGTVAGTVALQGSFNGTDWDDINTLTLANQALNRKKMLIPVPYDYPMYRIIFLTTGGQGTASARIMRRG